MMEGMKLIMKKRRMKKKKIRLLKMVCLIIVLIIIGLTFKRLVNIIHNKNDENVTLANNNDIVVNDVKVNVVDNNDEQKSASDIQVKRKEDSSSSSKQQEIKERRLNENKILSTDGLPVLMYHFFYDASKGETGQDGNWIEVSKFEEQMKYLSENEFYFPTWQEVEEYIDGKIELPEKSVVITVDDGDDSFFNLAVPIIQKYDVFATSFLVTYWYGNRAEDKQDNISYQSHSYDMHKGGANGKGVMLSWEYDKIKEDLELSSNVLGNANIFCYPFGQYNSSLFKVLKDTGYKLAFTTQGGRVKKGAEKFELPRVRISAETSLSAFKNKVE